MACHIYKKKCINITSKRVAALFIVVAKSIHPNTPKDKLLQYSVHSLQVWACVLLDKAGMSPKFIMSRLRWMGNLFRMYLRNTGMIQDKHRDIFQAASQEVLDQIARPHQAAPTVGCTLGWQFRLPESKFLACRNRRNPESGVFWQIPPE